MPYVITDSSGNPVVIPDGGLNRDYSVNLVGRNKQDYGFEIAQTQLRILENFASEIPPERPTTGQLWYDLDRNILTVYDQETRSWQPLVPLVSADEPSRDFNQVRPNGTMYYNTRSQQMFVSSNNDWVPAFTLGEISTSFEGEASLGNPTQYGSRLRTIFLEDTSQTPRAVLALTYVNNGSLPGVSNNNEKIIAIFSGHEAFEVRNPDTSRIGDISISYISELLETGGIGATIQPGMNLRADNGTRVAFSSVSDIANVAFSIATGNAESFSNVTIAEDIFNANTSSVPNSADTYDLGTANSMFANAYITNILVGNGVDGSILPNGNSNVNIGSNTNPIQSIFTDDITVSGSLIINNSNSDIGSNTTPVNNIFANNIVALESLSIDGYTMPTDAGNVGGALFTDGAGGTAWAPVTETSLTNGGGLTIAPDPVVASGAEPANKNYVVTVGQGLGINVNPSNIEVTLAPFSTTDLSEGTNLYFTDARARSAISAASGVNYDPGTGQITADPSEVRGLFSAGTGLTYNSATGQFSVSGANPFGGLTPEDFVRKTGSVPESITGIKTFNNRLFAPGGITMNNGDFVYTGTLSFTGSSGTVTFAQNGVVTGSDIVATSDARVKTNLERIGGALEKVEQLVGYTYNRSDLPSEAPRMTGLIAQDVNEVLPEAVVENEDGLMGVSYGSMMGLIVEAINELRAEVQELKKGTSE